MAAKFKSIDRETAYLLPPDMRDWVPEGHLVHFIIDAVDLLDLRSARVNERGSGEGREAGASGYGTLPRGTLVTRTETNYTPRHGHGELVEDLCIVLGHTGVG